MSYVLEALKKAQAQREQGGVPGIHSLQVPYVAVEGKARSNLKPVLWSIAVLLVAIVALLVWRQDATPAPAALAPAPPALVSVAPPAPVAPVVAPAPTPEPTPVAESLAKGEVQLAGPTPAERAAARKKERSQPKPPATAQTKSEPKAAEPRVYAVADLPEGVRRALPTLVISGGSYSTNPAQRLIIVNNQVFTEKSEPAPGVVVQSIEPSAAVLTYRGYAYRVGY